MVAGTYNFLYQQGTTLTFLIQYKDSLDAPIDLTDYLVRGQIRRRVRDDVTATIGLSIEDGPAGSIRAELTPSSFIDVPLKGDSPSDRNPFVYDIEIESPGGDVTRILQGTVSVTPEVTR